MTSRRQFLSQWAGAGAAGLGAGLGLFSLSGHSASPSGYKALVVIHLNGGNDANDMIVPTDAAFSDYTKARPSIALKSDMLLAISGTHLGHKMALNTACSSLLPLFNSGRLGFVVNAGALVKPTTAAQVLNGTATLPPYLYSHPEQTQYMQGWTGDEDPSGWGGRALENMDPGRTFKAPLITINTNDNTLVLGQKSRVINANSGGSRYMGKADLTDSTNRWTQILESLTRLQSVNNVEAEYARTFKGVFSDSKQLALADSMAQNPAGNFASDDIAVRLQYAAKIIPFYKSTGATRQIFQIQWGSFDTHANQRYTSVMTGNASQDTQLAELANAMAAFDESMVKAGLGNEVAVLITSEFGRTLDPAAGYGSDHAWGSHWMVMGGGVNGGRFYGDKFPSLVLGGVDDAHNQKRGYWVPQFSSDQVAADLLIWLGLPADQLTKVMPNLVNFSKKSVGFMNG